MRAYGKRPRAERYDLKTDPHEVHNIANDPRYAQTGADLERSLLSELERAGDPRLIDDGKFFETPPMAGPVVEATPAKARAKAKAKAKQSDQ